MLFKDRADAGNRLSASLLQNQYLRKHKEHIVVVSLLRGGLAVGKQIAAVFHCNNIPLVVAKIPYPDNPELAIGAICQEVVNINPGLTNRLRVDPEMLREQVEQARQKQKEYLHLYNLEKMEYGEHIKDKIVILTDDGIATGSSADAAGKFLSLQNPKKLILAVPAGPKNFYSGYFDEILVLYSDRYLSSVSEYYESFPQVKDI